MIIERQQLNELNKSALEDHQSEYDFLTDVLTKQGVNVGKLLDVLKNFSVAIPSWALGAGGTRFGRFSYVGEPSTLEEKIDDVGLIHQLTRTAGSISLHIPWDTPNDISAIREHASKRELTFDAVNSNTFQDTSYKFGSLSNTDEKVRGMAIEHNCEVIKIGDQLGSRSITIWLADGSAFPGQSNFQTAFSHTLESLQTIYGTMPEDWKMFIEYKPYEPNFYSTVVQDWGTSLLLATECGDKAFTLVDLGHHLPNTNIEQIVATLMLKGKLGGFHFNDSKYGDDDLTVGSIRPYALFLIFKELVYGMQTNEHNPGPAWMIDASHNIKDPLEDLMQSLEAICEAYAKALLIDQEQLLVAQLDNDVVKCQEIVQGAYRTDVRPLIREARLRAGGALNPLDSYRKLKIREQLVRERGADSRATGL